MIKVDHIMEILKLSFLTGAIADEQPISVILVANPECGKSRMIYRFMDVKTSAFVTDATAYGLIRDIMPKIERGEITHIVIPDMLKPLSRSQSTVKNLLTFLNALIEEGVVDMSVYFKQYDGRQKKGLKCGLITSITKDELYDRRHKWLRLGFMSRMLPISYDYSEETKKEIMTYINNQHHLKEDVVKFKIPKRKVKIELPAIHANRMNEFSFALALPMKLYGFRLQRQLQALLKASAFERGSRRVSSLDVDHIIRSMKYINLNFSVI